MVPMSGQKYYGVPKYKIEYIRAVAEEMCERKLMMEIPFRVHLEAYGRVSVTPYPEGYPQRIGAMLLDVLGALEEVEKAYRIASGRSYKWSDVAYPANKDAAEFFRTRHREDPHHSFSAVWDPVKGHCRRYTSE